MKVIVDHSIAHPAFMRMQLKDEYDKNDIKFTNGDDDPFWMGVLDDCRKSDILLVNSDFVKQTFVQQGYDAQKIKVVYLGVRKDFHGLKTDYAISARVRLLFTGSFSIRKGGEYLFKAMSILKKKNVCCELIIVGGCFDLNSQIDTFDNVRRIGMLPQDLLKEYLSTSDIYVFPSLCEGCAQSGMEALAAGLPVIATYESGLPIEDGFNGIIISSKDEEAIADAIIRLIHDKMLRERIGRNAVECMNEYTWENYALNVVNIYSQM